MTHNERELLIELARSYRTHLENTYRHLPTYQEGELTSTITHYLDAILSDPRATTPTVPDLDREPDNAEQLAAPSEG